MWAKIKVFFLGLLVGILSALATVAYWLITGKLKTPMTAKKQGKQPAEKPIEKKGPEESPPAKPPIHIGDDDQEEIDMRHQAQKETIDHGKETDNPRRHND